MARVADLTGESAPSVEGTLVRVDADTVGLEVWRTDLGVGEAFDPGRQRLLLQPRHIAGLAEKRLSYWKTGGLMGAIAVGLYVLYEAVWDGAGGGSGTTPPGDQF